MVLWIKFRWSAQWQKNTNCMHEYLYSYRMLPGAILKLYNSMTMYLTYSICKNKVSVDLEFLLLLHVNDGGRWGSFGNTVIEWLSKAIRVVDILYKV